MGIKKRVKEITVTGGLGPHSQKAMCNIIWSYMSYETSRLMHDVPLMCGHGMCAGTTPEEKDEAFQKEWNKKKEARTTLCKGVTTAECTKNAKAPDSSSESAEHNAYRCEGKVVGESGADFFSKASKCCQLKTGGVVAKRQRLIEMRKVEHESCIKKFKNDCPVTTGEKCCAPLPKEDIATIALMNSIPFQAGKDKVECKALDNEVEMSKAVEAVKALRHLLFERLAQAWTYLQGDKAKQEKDFETFDSLEMLPGTLSLWMSNHAHAVAVAKKIKGSGGLLDKMKAKKAAAAAAATS